MDRELYFFDTPRCYVVRWLADLSHESVMRHWKAVIDDPRFQPGDAALHDLRGRAIEVSRGGLRQRLETYRLEVEPRVGFGRVAILVDSDRTFDQASLLLELLQLEGGLVTRSETEAKTWIGLGADQPLAYR